MRIINLQTFHKDSYKFSISNQKSFLTKPCENDTFESSKNSRPVTFKANFTEICKKVLSNKKMAQQFMALMAMGTATVVTAANSDDKEAKNAETSDNIEELNFFQNIFSSFGNNKEEASIDSERINELEKENEKLREENLKLKSELETRNTDTQEIKEDEKNTNAHENNLSAVVFPKKWGKLSKQEVELKQTVESIKLSLVNALRLNEICQKVLKFKDLPADLSAEKLNNNLKSIANQEELEAYVEEVNEKYSSFAAESTVAKEDSNDELKVLEEIVLEDAKDKPRRKRIRVKEYQEPEITNKRIDGTFNYKIPGTVPYDCKINLTRILKEFEINIKKSNASKKPLWKTSFPIGIVSENDIIGEIRKRASEKSPYKNISVDFAFELSEIINSNDDLKKYFTLHSALRFIDRYVDFNSDIPLEDQIKKNLNLLKDAIQTGIKNGVEIEPYQDEKGYYAPRIIIKPDKKENPAAYELGGTYEILITLSEEKQSGRYNYKNKSPLICTIFSKNF